MPFLGKTPTKLLDANVNIDGGNIDGTTIGASSTAPATVSTFTSTGIDDNATSTAITIDASENVGIGTTSPDTALDINGNTSATPLTVRGGNASLASIDLIGGTSGTDNSSIRSKYNLHIDCNSTGAISNRSIVFGNGTTETMRIDSSGNVGIGTANTNGRKVSVTGTGDLMELRSTNSGAGGAQLDLIHNSASPADGDSVGLINFSNASAQMASIVGKSSSVSSNYGELHFGTRNGGTYNSSAMVLDRSGNVGIGTTSPQSYTGYKTLHVAGPTTTGSGLLYLTNSDSSLVGMAFAEGSQSRITFGSQTNHPVTFLTNDTERMRIDSSGNVGIGETSPGAKLQISQSSNSSDGLRVFSTGSGDVGQRAVLVSKFDNNTTTSQIFVQFAVNNNATTSGQINANGANAAAFGTWSDERLKENIVDLPPQLASICSLRPVEFDYKAGGHQIGFIAQEMQEIYSDVVGAGRDGMLGITGWSKTEARLVKAIQEQQAMIETLQAQVAELQGA
jgi:hypothetical protein